MGVQARRFLSLALAQFVAWRTGAFNDMAAGYAAGASETSANSSDVLVTILADYFVFLVGAGLFVPIIIAAVASRRTLAEQTVFAFYAFGELALVCAFFLTARWFLPLGIADAVLVLSFAIYTSWAMARVFGLGVARSIFAAIAYLTAILVGTIFAAGVATGIGSVAGR